jgi:hypothetical protein
LWPSGALAGFLEGDRLVIVHLNSSRLFLDSFCRCRTMLQGKDQIYGCNQQKPKRDDP